MYVVQFFVGRKKVKYLKKSLFFQPPRQIEPLDQKYVLQFIFSKIKRNPIIILFWQKLYQRSILHVWSSDSELKKIGLRKKGFFSGLI